jgi:hypothetical protein
MQYRCNSPHGGFTFRMMTQLSIDAGRLRKWAMIAQPAEGKVHMLTDGGEHQMYQDMTACGPEALICAAVKLHRGWCFRQALQNSILRRSVPIVASNTVARSVPIVASNTLAHSKLSS